MFEGSLVESRGLVVSRAQRWSAAGSAAVQLILAALIVAIPLMRPQAIKDLVAVPHLTAPPIQVRPPELVRMVRTRQWFAGPAMPSAPAPSSPGTTHFSLTPGMPADEPSEPLGQIVMGAGPSTMPSLGAGNWPAVTVAPAAHDEPLNISRGVSEGMLLAPIRPEYPTIARDVHVQGTVVVQAVISKTGKIESAHAVSGPAMLQQAAVDAVASARYRPYLLSGEPVEVQTTVTVVFRLGE